ncbi:tetratricopeptide repeat protein [Thiorhodococcus mannitoliphagus]|uniref:Ancillary SecYEG translocon subunit n=1 Tax=Thiorhodococcus mannitoliphagus TaxID=329406 RepID=A0A6P1DR11_9GAMM|nr:tetratricopeptide repeat protein [Thiorhodococcus mannitoliphagus]
MTYETDEEKVEALKKWWKENGLSVVGGVVLGLGAIYGWRLWTGHQESVAAQASSAFEQLATNASAGSPQPDAIAKQLQLLESEFGSTPYPGLGALMAAKAMYQAGKTSEATAALQKAISDAPDPALARIAALRLARIQLAEGELDAAEKTVREHDISAAFAGEFAAVRGDIAAKRGDLSAARAAYEEAIEKGSALSQLLRLKIDNLPAAG